jgi:hypothetical protein
MAEPSELFLHRLYYSFPILVSALPDHRTQLIVDS